MPKKINFQNFNMEETIENHEKILEDIEEKLQYHKEKIESLTKLKESYIEILKITKGE